jgi:hypothetical protein
MEIAGKSGAKFTALLSTRSTLAAMCTAQSADHMCSSERQGGAKLEAGKLMATATARRINSPAVVPLLDIYPDRPEFSGDREGVP